MIKAYLDSDETKTMVFEPFIPKSLSHRCFLVAAHANGSGLRLLLFIGKAAQHQLPSSLVPTIADR
jgi:hypothetical protein